MAGGGSVDGDGDSTSIVDDGDGDGADKDVTIFAGEELVSAPSSGGCCRCGILRLVDDRKIVGRKVVWR